jgi:hypothetical protein
MGPILVKMTGQTLIFTEAELSHIFMQHHPEYVRALKRGKYELRTQSKERREAPDGRQEQRQEARLDKQTARP